MHRIVRAARVGLAVAAVVLLLPGGAHSQGITTASVRGTIVDEARVPVAQVTVTLVNSSTGQRFRAVTRADGRYNIENVPVGGPYALEAQLIGYRPAAREGFALTLGQVLNLDMTMSRAAVALEAVTVTAQEQNPLTASSRTGTGGYVSDSAVNRLPSLNRNFTDFVATIPQVASVQDQAPSLGGGHNRMNNVQIDGVSDNDLFGLGSTGQPGGQVDAKSITLEAVKEYQVLIAPFDVRQSGFSGGLVNAVTKRGTNELHGSAFWYFQDDALVRDSLCVQDCDTPTPFKSGFGQYRQNQRGFSLGGPIIRDRLQAFVAAEFQGRGSPNTGQTIGRDPPDQVQVSPDSAQRLVDIMSNVYGFDAGDYRARTDENPNTNIFARLDFQLSNDHILTLRHNYVGAKDDLNYSHSPFSYELTSGAYTIDNKTNSTVLQLNSTLAGGRFFNELRLGYLRVRDARDPAVPWAALEVDNDSDIGGNIFGNQFNLGAERFSQRNRLDQDVWELTDDFTIATGNHTVTIGTHNELIAFDNTFFHTSIGRWRFSSLAALEAGTPDDYFVQIPFPGVTDQTTAGRADWSLTQLGFYAQDQWEVTPNFRLTAGLRLDVPIINDVPKENPALASSAIEYVTSSGDSVHVFTDQIPSGNLHWAPRAGFNWDVRGDRSMVLRGGLGLFTGRPAYVWLSNAFTNTGRDIVTVFCSAGAGNLPAFNSTTMVDPPQDCVGTSGISTPRSQVNFFDKNFKFPQEFKASFAIDKRLPGDLIATIEGLYTKGVNTIYQQELNIPSSPLSVNAEGRWLYGDPALYNGGVPPARVDTNFAHILRHTNRSSDRAYSLTLQLQRSFEAGFEFSAGYTYQRVEDLTSLGSSIASSNYGFSVVSRGRDPNNKELTRSFFDVPHRVVVSGSVDLPVPLPTALTLIYVGQSGTPFTWNIDGDINGDGYEAPEIGSRHNDIIYVPASESDFSADGATDWDRFQALIGSMDCLQQSRGLIMERNTCRNPWTNRLDANLRISFGHAVGARWNNLTLVWDVFNVLNFLNGNWGLNRSISFFETRTALQLRGYDTANDRGIYRYIGPDVLSDPENLADVSDLSSRWRMQLGLRYDF